MPKGIPSHIEKSGGCWPTSPQLLLLKAALLPEALGHWRQWLQETGMDALRMDDPEFLPKFFDPLDMGSERLMPLVHKNLEKSGDAFVGRLKGHRKNTWLRNNYIAQRLLSVAQALSREGIDHLMLKGIPMGVLYYKDLGIRPMGDGDIMVHISQQKDAIRLLMGAPFHCKVKNELNKAISKNHAICLKTPEGLDIDLHWNLFKEHAYVPGIDEGIWNGRIPFKLGTLESWALSPTHQFFHALAHGHKYCFVPPFRWVADCFFIAKNATIDWEEVSKLAIHYKYVPFTLMALTLLRDEFGLAVPERCFQYLSAYSLPEAEKKYHLLATTPLLQGNTPNIRVRRYWRRVKLRYYAYLSFRKEKEGGSFLYWYAKFLVTGYLHKWDDEDV